MKAQARPLTPPQDLVDEAQTYAPDGNLSTYVADRLYRRVLSHRPARYLRERDDECGPLTDEDLEVADREWQSGR